jgi:hypothetical protein
MNERKDAKFYSLIEKAREVVKEHNMAFDENMAADDDDYCLVKTHGIL